MVKKKPQHMQRANEKERKELPPDVELFCTLEGHREVVRSLAFSPRGFALASGSGDHTVKLWDVGSGKLLRTLEGHQDSVNSVAFDPRGGMVASGSNDNTVKLWEVDSGKLLRTLEGHQDSVNSVAFDPRSGMVASGSNDNTVKLWKVSSGKQLRTLKGHQDWINSVAFDSQGSMLASGSDDTTVKFWETPNGKLLRTGKGHRNLVNSVAFDPLGGMLASGDATNTVNLWNARSGKLLRTLEGHTGVVNNVAFSADGQLLASMSQDHTIRLWSCATWETLRVIPTTLAEMDWWTGLAFHPTQPLLAASTGEQSHIIHLWKLNLDVLLGSRAGAAAPRAVHRTTGKVVLVGDHSVGKSALGYRLIHGAFKAQASTHGQQFWVFPALGQHRADGTECEAILWDFAGQPDYRLVHALFVDNADLALVLFDASDLGDPLHGVNFWLKQLQAGQSRCPIILVAAQTDRGTCSLTPDELRAFCRKHGIEGPITTSALTGLGFQQLVERMKSMIPWDDKPATVTTTTFKRIKDYVLGLKEAKSDGQIIVTPKELRGRLEASDADWRFTDAEMLTAVGHLENYGYVKRLRTSKGEQRVLLQPERLNNLASSFVLEARRNPRGLGALEEKRLLTGGYDFPELKHLHKNECDVLLDSAAMLFLEHNVCFRETDPLRMEPYLVFPELINLKKPPEEPEEETAIEDGVAYTVSGATENVFASLVVLLGYTHTFTRTAQWHKNARYEVGNGLACAFRQETERDGELDFVLSFGPKVGLPVRTLFQGLFESFLARQNLTVMRYEPVRCPNVICGHLLQRSVVRQRLKEGKTFAFATIAVTNYPCRRWQSRSS
jgi:small GTP-binding protein